MRPARELLLTWSVHNIGCATRLLPSSRSGAIGAPAFVDNVSELDWHA
jgi:hypothetical protein